MICKKFYGAILVALILSVGVTSVFAQGNNTVIVNFPDFSDISALTLSGSTQNYGNPVNSGGQDILRLTNATGGQAGGAFLTDPISLQNGASFSTYFTFQMTGAGGFGDGDGLGADGFVFVVQTESNQFGQAGGGLGYLGIDNSLGIEFDTYNNGAPDGHNGNHVGIDFNGDYYSVQRYNVGTRMNNGAVWHVWVDYDGSSQTLEIRLAQNDTRPANPTMSRNVDLPSYLGQDEAYVGFTAATGGAYENHDIRSWYFTNDFAPIEEIPVQVTWQYNGHIYEAVSGAGLTWPEANDLANAMSFYDVNGNYWYAHLLTVTSADENQFIVDNFLPQIQQLYFLGGHQVNFDNEPAGGWAWVTGEPWDYTNWGANEPNNQYGTEQITHFWNNNGGWNDHQLNWQGNGYIVEYEIQDPSAPEISVSTASLDFGGVLVNTNSDLTLTISNEGDADLNVSNVSIAGAGFSSDFGGAFTLAPGASQDVTVTFSPNATGNYSGTATVSSDDADEGSLTVNLTGTGIAPEIEVNPTSLAFGEVALFGEAQLTFDVSNSGSAALNVSAMNVTGDDFSVNFGGAVAIGVGASQTFTVTYSADNYGAVNGSIAISSDDEDEPVVTVTLSGTAIAPIITVDPALLDFGTNEFRRDVADLTFEVCNEGNTGGNVNSMTVTGANFSCDFGGAFALAAGECATITVSFEAEEVGEASGDIEIESDDPVNGTANVSLAAEVIWVPSTTLLGRLCEQVDGLPLNRGQKNSLCVKIRNAINHLERNKPNQALSMLNAFNNHVVSFVEEGVLTAAQGQSLIDEANFITALISEFGTAGRGEISLEDEPMPVSVGIDAAYPNPFNATATIRYGLVEAGMVNLTVLDLSGREVMRLASGYHSAGFHEVSLNGHDLQSGVYLVRMNALGTNSFTKLTLIK